MRHSPVTGIVAGGILALMAASLTTHANAAFPGGDGLLAFTRSGIWVASGSVAAGTYQERRLTSGDHRNPRWSSDGSRIVFNTRLGKVRTVSSDGSVKRTLVAERAFQPAYSPVLSGGRERVLYVRVPPGRGGDIWSVPSTGGTATRLTRDGAGSCGNSWPTWSPDRRYVAWVHQDLDPTVGCNVDEPADVVVLDRRTGTRRTVPTVFDEQILSEVVPDPERLSFTADGAWLIYGAVDDGCIHLRGRYGVATRTAEAVIFFSCEGETASGQDEYVPTPGGGFVFADPFGVSWPGGRYPFGGGRPRMHSFDVQPVG